MSEAPHFICKGQSRNEALYFREANSLCGLAVVMQREGETNQLRWLRTLRWDGAQPSSLHPHQWPQRMDSALTHIRGFCKQRATTSQTGIPAQDKVNPVGLMLS